MTKPEYLKEIAVKLYDLQSYSDGKNVIDSYAMGNLMEQMVSRVGDNINLNNVKNIHLYSDDEPRYIMHHENAHQNSYENRLKVQVIFNNYGIATFEVSYNAHVEGDAPTIADK